ncbi:claudin-34 [Spea bombifrons]|uniref:claudin-34 n=1 Tax=Spea bombifrons TaxID=233779 RepID=UPI00234BE69C|nr:claudin-34 [Spea bombifrons]XP_053312850.1 claudin-34 [Spea bombifrons]
MPYLAHTAHLQLAGFAFATVGWILSSVTTGLVQWRVWHVANTTIITSGIAWIGIWRTCFFSQVLVSPNQEIMYCQEFSVTDSFIPVEIFVAQGLMVVAIILGATGKAFAACGLRNVYQGSSRITLIHYWFTVGGILNLLSSFCIIIPVAWNLHSVINNYGISFPSTYDMPSSPETQEVGAAIPVGIVSAILLFLSGTFFLSYRLPDTLISKVSPLSPEESIFSDSLSMSSRFSSKSLSLASRKHFTKPVLNCDGIYNEAYESELDEKL